MGNELLSPKVIVQEAPPGIRTIEGVSTATTGIVGIFERGPVRTPKLVTSWAEFKKRYGTFITAGKGPEGVFGYFLNGGKQLWVSRTVHYTTISDPLTKTSVAATITLKDRAGTPLNTLRVDALYDGIWGNDLKVDIKAPTSGKETGSTAEFNLEVIEDGIVKEIFPNVSMLDTAKNYVETVINATDGTGSDLIKVTDLDSATAAPNDRPAVAQTALAGGVDGLAALADADFTGDSAGTTGIRAFDIVNDIRILIIPDRQTTAVHQGMQDYCEITRNKSMFAILDPPVANSYTAVVTYVETTAALLERSEFSAFYWPWVKVVNPSTTVYGGVADITVPPSGYLAGLYAQNDGRKVGGIYEQPANIENGILRGVIGLETETVNDETRRDYIYPRRINPIWKPPGLPIHVDGSRTLKALGNFPSVAERRGVIYISESVRTGIVFAKHRNNDDRLRAEVEAAIKLFLLLQYRAGAFRGSTPDKSFFVDVSKDLNTPAVVFSRRLLVNIGLATQKPAEFIIITISQDTRELEEELAGV